MKHTFILPALASLSIFTGALFAQTSQPTSPAPLKAAVPAPEAFPGNQTGGMVQVFGCLLLFAGMLGGGFYMIRSGPGLFRAKNKGDRKLVISETRMLGNRQFLVVAEYEEKKLLIGVCPGRIDYLCALNGTDETFSTVLRDKQE